MRWSSFLYVPSCSVAQSCPTLCNPVDCNPPGSLSWESPGKNTGVGCHSLLQGIFPTQGSNLCLLHWQVVSYVYYPSKSIATCYRHLVKITVSGKASPSRSPPQHPPSFSWREVFKQRRETQMWNFLCSIWGMKLKGHRCAVCTDRGMMGRREESRGSFHMLRSLQKSLTPTAPFWAELVPHGSDVSKEAHKISPASCPPVDTVTWCDPSRDPSWQCFQRGLSVQAGWTDGVWFSQGWWLLVGVGGRQCREPWTLWQSSDFSKIHSGSFQSCRNEPEWLQMAQGLQVTMQTESYFDLKLVAGVRVVGGSEMDKIWILSTVWKYFISFILVTQIK